MIYKVGCLKRGPNGRPLPTLVAVLIDAESGDDAAEMAFRLEEGVVAVKSVVPATDADMPGDAAALEGEESGAGDDAPERDDALLVALQTPEEPAEKPKRGGRK